MSRLQNNYVQMHNCINRAD